MIDIPKDRLPTLDELHAWRFDLAMRLIGAGQRDVVRHDKLNRRSIDLYGSLQGEYDEHGGQGGGS